MWGLVGKHDVTPSVDTAAAAAAAAPTAAAAGLERLNTVLLVKLLYLREDRAFLETQ